MALQVAYSREEALEKVKKSGRVLEYLDANLRADRELVLEAVRRHGLSLRFASKELRADREVVLEAVTNLGKALEFASDELRADRAFVLEAVKQHEWALEFTADIADSGKTVHGIDLVSLCEEGQIAEFTVLARPPNAVEQLKSEMMRRVPVRLAALKAKQALGFA